MFKGKTTTQQRTDVVFQILHYILTDGKEPTPFHDMVGQTVHSLTRSKDLMTAFSHYRICVSYNTVKRIDIDLAERIITAAGDNREPLPSVLEATSPINGTMDNFDRNESTLAGTGSTHDTILVLFQNVPINLEKLPQEHEISAMTLATLSRTTVKLRTQVKCQQIIKMGAVKERGEIPTNYKASSSAIEFLTTDLDDFSVETPSNALTSTTAAEDWDIYQQIPLTS